MTEVPSPRPQQADNAAGPRGRAVLRRGSGLKQGRSGGVEFWDSETHHGAQSTSITVIPHQYHTSITPVSHQYHTGITPSCRHRGVLGQLLL